jgi:hypothetical protein
MTTERFWTLLSGVFGVSAISVLALALSAADGRLRLELQSSVVAPISPPPTREGFDEEIDRLRRLVEALKNEITKLKEAREQTAQMIAALGAPEQQSPDPAPTHWYLQSAFSSGIESEPKREDVTPLPRPPLTARPALRRAEQSENRGAFRRKLRSN